MKDYVLDTVDGYRLAAEKLRAASSLDSGNVKALAMLASTYLNLIDSLNKDENYFSVIYKLIDLARVKAVDIPEVVIADVEFFITVHKAEAAQNRIVEYTKDHNNFELEMFYYLALSFFHRGDYQNAARYLSQYPENKVTSAKIFHLRGLTAERLNDYEAALSEYDKAVKFNRNHAKSRLRIAEIKNAMGKLSDVAPHLDFLVENPQLLAPKDLALSYFLHSRLAQVLKRQDIALRDIEMAVNLDRGNSDFLLEYYTLKAKSGESVASAKKQARMYFFLGEGEKLLKQGKPQEALTQFLQARQAYDESPIPLIRAGDMFRNQNDLENARLNYRLAADRAPKSIEVWSKYIDVLIRTYEWDEAQKAMDKFRKLPVNQSAIDKAAADMYEKQGLHLQAQLFYKRAMARDSIDPDVYVAFGRSLMSTKNYKEAPFFFALAQRLDPMNLEALIGTAKCVAAVESIDRGIIMLQDELQKNTGARAELVAAIAELQIQKGDWEQAQLNVDQARLAKPELAHPWKLQALIHLNNEGRDRKALEKALEAYQSYIERNPSDPTVYLERYRIYARRTDYEKALDELGRIHQILPRYPSLKYHRGVLYGIMGNHRQALEELKGEIANNPQNVQAQIALGKEQIELGAYTDALASLNKAMQLAPRSAEARQQAGYAHYLLKNYPAAVALYQAALSMDRANSLIYKRLGLAYRDSGNMAAAADAFRKYLEMEPDAPDKAEFQMYR